MKWFKHISDSLDDPKMFELIRRHRANGYLVFFGILEVYAREFKTDPDWELVTSLAYLKRKFHLFHTKILLKCIQSCADLLLFNAKIEGDIIRISIPKFRKLLDETTIKKLRDSEKRAGKFRNGSGRLPKNVCTDKDKEKEKDIITPETGLYKNKSVKNAGDFEKEINETCEKIKTLPPKNDKKQFNPYEWAQYQLNNNSHPGAILECLEGLIKPWPDIEDPWAYANSIMKTVGGNWWEQDHINKSENYKKLLSDLAKQLSLNP